MLQRLRSASDRVMEAAAVMAMVAMLGCVMLGVITRALDDPLIWTDEMARLLLVWVAALGWMLATRRRGHIRILFLVDRLPDRWRRSAEAVIQLMMFLFGALLALRGLELVQRNADLEATSVPISIAWLYLPIVLCGITDALQAAGEIWIAATRSGPLPSADEGRVE